MIQSFHKIHKFTNAVISTYSEFGDVTERWRERKRERAVKERGGWRGRERGRGRGRESDR